MTELAFAEQLFSTTSGLSTLLNEAEDSGVEHFEDVPEEGEDKRQKPSAVVDDKPLNEYDGRKRDPLFANAKSSCLWELVSREWSRLSGTQAAQYTLQL